jgi:hypothetical protein
MIKKIVTLILSFPYVTAIQIIEVLLFFEKCRTSYFLSHEKDYIYNIDVIYNLC